MSNICTPADPGQNPAPSTPLDPAVAAEILGAVRELSARLNALDERFERLHRRAHKAIAANPRPAPAEPPERPSARSAPGLTPALALRSDGKVLLATAYLAGADLAARERWEGVVLHSADACDMLGPVGEGCDGAGSIIAARILRRDEKGRG